MLQRQSHGQGAWGVGGEVGSVILLVFGGYGEVSEEVHDLIGTLAYLRHAMESRAGGREGAEGRMGKSKGISGED